jgi:uncharacterized protein (TIGR00369 family)
MGKSGRERFEKDLQQRFHGSKTTKTFGFRMVRMQRGRVTLGMKVAPRFLQVHGQLHGGIIATLADTAAALAAYTVIPAGSKLVTLEMKINFLEGVERGDVTALGRVLRPGRNTIVSESDVRDAAGKLVAKALVTLAVKVGPKQEC